MKRAKDNLVEQLYTDFHRLNCIGFGDRPEGIDLNDLFRATPLGGPIGATSPEIDEKFGIHPTEPIERVCKALAVHANTLLEKKAKGEGAPTRHQKAVPESTINFLAWEMLVRCNNSGILPPMALLELVRQQLGIRSRQKSDDEEELAWKECDAARFAFNNPDASLRQIAKRYDVNISTVSRWNKEINLRERGKMIQQMCDETDRQWKTIHERVGEESEALDTEYKKDIKKI